MRLYQTDSPSGPRKVGRMGTDGHLSRFDRLSSGMFKNLSTSRKLFILCSMFVIALGVTTYSLVTEKLIAIEFARKELAGNRYLDTIRRIYEAILIGRSSPGGTASSGLSADSLLRALAGAEAETRGSLQTAELEQALAAKLEALWSDNTARGGSADPIVDAVAAARALAQRIGDNSNLTLDPDLDTYYIQNIIVQVLPALLGQLGELAMLWPEVRPRPLLRAGACACWCLTRSAPGKHRGDRRERLASAYRGNADGRLEPTVDAAFAATISAANSYADASRLVGGRRGFSLARRQLHQRCRKRDQRLDRCRARARPAPRAAHRRSRPSARRASSSPLSSAASAFSSPC